MEFRVKVRDPITQELRVLKIEAENKQAAAQLAREMIALKKESQQTGQDDEKEASTRFIRDLLAKEQQNKGGADKGKHESRVRGSSEEQQTVNVSDIKVSPPDSDTQLTQASEDKEMLMDWFYLRSGQITGPLSAQQLRDHALAGKLTTSDHVRQDGDSTWYAATDVSGLFDPPPPPPPPPIVIPPTAPISTPVNNTSRLVYKVLTQKDKWLSSKFDPKTLETALNSYGQQGWRVRSGDTASFPGILSSKREELITILERDEGLTHMEKHEYKVLTQKDKWYSGKFDPDRLEGALNAYAKQGWQVVFGTTASFPGFFGRNAEELIIVLSRKVG